MKNTILLGLFTLSLSSFSQSSGMAPSSLRLKELFGDKEIIQRIYKEYQGRLLPEEATQSIASCVDSVMVQAFCIGAARSKGMVGSDFFYAGTLVLLDELLKSGTSSKEESIMLNEAIKHLAPFQQDGHGIGEGVSIQLAASDFIKTIPSDKKQLAIEFIEKNKSNEPVVAKIIAFLNVYYQAREVSSKVSRSEVEALGKRAEEELREFSSFVLTQLSRR